jgi:hypothetical protein
VRQRRWRPRRGRGAGTTTKSLWSVDCKVLFHNGCHNRYNLYDTKNESFVLAVIDRYKKLQLGVDCLCQLTRKIDFQKQKKTLEPRSRPIGPRSGPRSPLSMTPRRKQLSPSPQSRPEVERAAERRHLLAEVDRAVMPLERCRLLGRGRGLPSCAAL